MEEQQLQEATWTLQRVTDVESAHFVPLLRSRGLAERQALGPGAWLWRRRRAGRRRSSWTRSRAAAAARPRAGTAARS
jgi:hypothetical protein